MCHAVRCNVCGKTTWAGCGQHIAQVKASVPKGQWCDGRRTPEEIAAARRSSSVFGRLFAN